MKRLALGACIALVVTLVASNLGGATRAQSPTRSSRLPAGLTQEGRLLWNFEGLLRRSFPRQRVVSVRPFTTTRSFLDFSCAGFCGPDYRYFEYVFRRPAGSTFHLSSRRFSNGYFGVQSVQVLIRGRSVACDRQEKRFLIAYPNALHLSLACR